MSKYGKSYPTKEEFEKRKEIFLQTREKIETRNAQPGLKYRLGYNKFADWTKDEYRRLLKYNKNAYSGAPVKVLNEGDIPQQLDWTEKNVVNDV